MMTALTVSCKPGGHPMARASRCCAHKGEAICSVRFDLNVLAMIGKYHNLGEVLTPCPAFGIL